MPFENIELRLISEHTRKVNSTLKQIMLNMFRNDIPGMSGWRQ